jgi:hypothetical protein
LSAFRKAAVKATGSKPTGKLVGEPKATGSKPTGPARCLVTTGTST